MSQDLYSYIYQSDAQALLQEAPADQVVTTRWGSQELLHGLKLDKRLDARTLCGVKISNTSTHWRYEGTKPVTDHGVTCPTCQAALAKLGGRAPTAPDARRGIPEATETASVHRPLCVAVFDGVPVRNPRGRHSENVLKTRYDGTPVAPWCTWCGQSLEEGAGQEPAPSAQIVDSELTDMFYLNHGAERPANGETD